jgi:glycosyl transferase family 4
MRLSTIVGQNNHTGYGRMGRELVNALRAEGVTLDDCPSPENENRNTVHANALWMGAPSHIGGWWEGQRTHVLTMWEATGVPPGFRENVHEIDTIVVPSQQNLELFSHWHKNVRKVPLGIDAERWRYRERPPIEREFCFMTAGQGKRKGIDIVTRAFSTVFGDFTPSPSDPVPTLVVKDRNAIKGPKPERMTEITGIIPEAAEVELYAQAHCFIGVARGEGWGMMPFQAMAQGCPTILADAHGYAEFAHLAAQKISCGMSKAEPFIFGDADQWWEPNFEEVCAAMWEIYANYARYLNGAAESADHIARHYTWRHSAAKLIDAMGGQKALELPDITERTWHKPTIQQFWVVTERDCGIEVNGIVHRFNKGEDYWIFGDAKRMLYELGYLDPRCLTDIHASGLTPEQLSDIDRYRSQHERCQACGQKFNTDQSLDFDDEDVGELVP